MSTTRVAKTPVWERGRAGRLFGAVVDYARTAWWGLVGGHVTEKTRLELAQAVILRQTPAGATGSSPSDEVLLSIRSDLFGWELPGGTIESGESPANALIREVKEETGLIVEIEAHVGDWTRTGFRPHVAHIYRARVVGGVLRPSSETPRLNWFEATHPPTELFPWYEEPLEQGLKKGAPVTRCERQGIDAITRAMRIDLGLRWRGIPPDRTLR